MIHLKHYGFIYTQEFKEEAVALVTEQGYSVPGCWFNNSTLVHSGVFSWLVSLLGDNKSARYAASFQLLKSQI
jgi:hypothetical protein